MSKCLNDADLADDMGRLAEYPLEWAMYSFPWDAEPAIQVVELSEKYQKRFNCKYGLDDWACEFLDSLGEQIRARNFNGAVPVEPIREATCSGHGIGKSQISAILILFILSTRPHSKGIVTANTSAQLRTKTWAEVGKWLKYCITGHWFEFNNSNGNMNIFHKQHKDTWRADGQTCREENSEAFAGLHAATSSPFYLVDEASAVPMKIFEVMEGGLTDGEPMMFLFGNGTRNSGGFFNAFNKLRHRYNCRKVDSRSVKITNKSLINQWIQDYGEDSDFFRVRVMGEFPRASSMQFISNYLINILELQEYEYRHSAIVIGVDVARFGDDQSVIVVRKGQQMLSIKKFRGIDTMALSSQVALVANEIHPDMIFVDEGGIGGGVVDRLRQLGFKRLIGVQFGSSATDNVSYFNKRSEMWGLMREWMRSGGRVLEDDELKTDLTSIEYGFSAKDQIQLEKKKDMKRRGLASPDCADALAITFAEPVMPHTEQQVRDRYVEQYQEESYDPIAYS